MLYMHTIHVFCNMRQKSNFQQKKGEKTKQKEKLVKAMLETKKTLTTDTKNLKQKEQITGKTIFEERINLQKIQKFET
jgi:hypothetical protein